VTETEIPPPEPPPSDVAPVTIEEEMRRSYLDYAMSVIVSRALPDVRDGLKPVHRRILFGMHDQGVTHDKPYRKSARIVGDVMGKYHPHGDQAIYDAMVRMAQTFAMRLPLLDGQGNFGSMDGDPPAAMRYTEIRMAESAEALLKDIDKDTVDFTSNYDDTTHEPSVLPACFPNLLANGAGGIAVGMATNIPPHTLGEIIDACLAFLDDPGISVDDLMAYVPAPDFPTGGLIMGTTGARQAYHTGRGSVTMRAKHNFEVLAKEREAIIITEVPYQVNKARVVEHIAELARDKRIEGISDLRDESDRDGVRVVIEIKRDAMAEIVLNQLFRYTQLQTNFGMNVLALNGGKPLLHSLKDLIFAFTDFREEVITRRTRYNLGKARERAQVLVGLAIAVANIDQIIAIIRKSADPAVAREGLMERAWPVGDVGSLVTLIDEPGRVVAEDGTYRLSEFQARAILDLRLQRLTALERDKIGDELKEIAEKIKDFLDILRSRPRMLGILRDELVEVREKFATPRRTEILEGNFENQDDEDLIQREDMVVTVSHTGYIKRVPLSTYRPQRRGGKGRAGMSTREEDFVAKVYVVNTHTPVLFFSSHGRVYKKKTYRMPLAPPNARGKPMQNLLPLAEGEVIHTLMPLPEDEEEWRNFHVMFATATGNVRRNALSDFAVVKANGKIAMKLDEGDQIIGVRLCHEDDDVLLTARGGKCIRFQVTEVRVFKGRDSTGVRGIRLDAGDDVMGMSILQHVESPPPEARAYVRQSNALRRSEDAEADVEAEVASTPEPEFESDDENGPEEVVLTEDRFAELEEREEFILSVTENGYGKRTSAYEYRTTRRGGKGIVNIITSERNGGVVASGPIAREDQIMLVTDGGQIIRTPVVDVRIAGRNTQGVTLFDTAEDERVVSVSRLEESTINGSEDGMAEDDEDADADSEAEALESANETESGTSDSEPDASEAAGEITEPADDTEEQE
jgi:DNA gyrase subunit A